MNAPEPSQQTTRPVESKPDSGKQPLTEAAMIEFASVLDDFMDEEVVDKQGAAIGTLACYWESVAGLLVFLGIKIKGKEGIHVVPGRRSQVDVQHACIHLDFEAAASESAPQFD